MNDIELTPPAIPENADVVQQVANEMLGIENTSLAVPEDPVDAVLRENGFANLPSNNSVIQRADSILVVPENNRPAETRPITEGEYVDAEVVESNSSEENIPTPEEEEHINHFRAEFERIINESTGISESLQDTSESEQERLDFEEESERLAAESEAEEYENNEDYDETAEENQDINVDEILQTAVPTDIMEYAIASAMEGAETVSNEAPVEISKEDLLTMLPVNSKSFEVKESTTRFSGASWYNDITEQTVIIAGQGGIGSWATMIMSRMHPKQLFIYDDDEVETVNLAGQLYSKSMVNKKKVDAMANLVKDFSDYNAVMAIAQKWTEETQPGDIMICGFDNMKARKAFFHSWLRHILGHPHPKKCLFIDGRLAFTDMQVFCITGDDTYNIKRYNDEYLFDDKDADETVCSMKQTTYCACMIGGLIVNLFTNFIANLQTPFSHDLPFKTFYDSNMLYLKTES